MKTFLYCESAEGGMDTQIVFEGGTPDLYGWMVGDCRLGDHALVAWMQWADIGAYVEHRLGIMVRLLDRL